MSEHIYRSHNKTLLLYHLVFPVKYRKAVITEEISETLKGICLGISERYELHFVEIGTDSDHVHFLVQSVPMLSLTEIIRTIKSITAKKLFERHEELTAQLWGGNFWTSGYYANTVGKYGNEEVIKKYVESQGMEYKKIYCTQLTLFG